MTNVLATPSSVQKLPVAVVVEPTVVAAVVAYSADFVVAVVAAVASAHLQPSKNLLRHRCSPTKLEKQD